jgi:small-conductance mechanosensitive channel
MFNLTTLTSAVPNGNELQQLFFRLIYFGVLLLVLSLYWIFQRLILKLLSKRIKQPIFTIILTIVTITVAFIDNLPVFFGSLSVLSAALVFALQDFVSCFFAWMYIELSRQYAINETILITSDNRQIYGVVSEIGLFRTKIQEKLGDQTLDREMSTGRLLTFPNNYIFKHSLTNVTKNHMLLVHKFKVVITFTTSYKKANQIIEKVVHTVFEQLLKKPERYFDTEVTDLSNYIPQVYHNIEDSGVAFTIWFGCRAGRLRQVLEVYSSALLDAFEENDIEMAYTTYRVVK